MLTRRKMESLKPIKRDRWGRYYCWSACSLKKVWSLDDGSAPVHAPGSRHAGLKLWKSNPTSA